MISRYKGTQWDFYQEIWNPSLEAITEIERNGIRLNPTQCLQGETESQYDLEQQEKQLHEWTDGWVTNWNSWKQVAEWFYDVRKFPIPPVCGSLKAVKKTKQGKRPQDQAACDWLSKNLPDQYDRDMMRVLLERNKSATLGNFCSRLPKYMDDRQRLHSVLKPSTDTGRLSSSNPALQLIPLEDKYNIRKAFVASPGNKLVVCDMSQLEMYIIADFCAKLFDDTSLAEDLVSADFHSSTAFRAWPWLDQYTTIADLKEDPTHGEYRKLAKTVNYSRVYGKTAYGLGAQIQNEDGTPIGTEAAQKILDDTAYEGLTRYTQGIHKFAEKHGYVETILGRRRLIPEAKWKGSWKQQQAFRQAGNTPVQGSAADIMTLALLLLFNHPVIRRIARICLQIHDEFILECAERHAQEVLEITVECMEKAFELYVPLKVTGTYCDSWDEGK